MAKIVLDTNFILECIKNRVDFFEELLVRGHRILIPKEVISEIKRLCDSSKALRFKENATLALRLLESEDFELIDAPGRYVDKGIQKYCSLNPDVILATMDKELKRYNEKLFKWIFHLNFD